MESEPKVITFGRRKKSGDAKALPKKENVAPPPPSPGAVLTPVQGPGAKASNKSPDEEQGKDIPARWRRKGANAKNRLGAEQQAYLAELKAHFDEIDAFELTVETPTPPSRHTESRIWRDMAKPRPMSLGLSTRRSTLSRPRLSSRSLTMTSPSPLKINLGPRTSLHPLPEDEPAVEPDSAVVPTTGRPSQAWTRHRGRSSVSLSGAPPTGRRSSAATTLATARRSSAAEKMLNRVSVGINDALQWLTRRGSLIEGGIEEEEEEEEDAGPRLSTLRTFDLTSDDTTTTVADGDARGGETAEDAGIFTIEEEGEGEDIASPPGTVATVADTIEETTTTATPVPASAAKDLEKEFASKLALEKEEEEEEAPATAPKADTEEKDSALPATPAALSPAFAELEPLQQLLKLCGQSTDVATLPTMDKLLGQHVNLNKVKKIGEGTFGEAFKAGNVVLKIVPMEGSVLVNGEPQKRAEEILAEVAITLTLSGLRDEFDNSEDVENNRPENNNNDKGQTKKNKGKNKNAINDYSSNSSSSNNMMKRRANVTAGFVETYGVGICRGTYAEALRKEWHRWDKINASENDPVDIFQDDQLFVVFVVADGGIDLEHFQPRSFEEIRSILMQVCMTLAVAEEACEFEHRDLHWGNLLISRDGTTSVPYRLRDIDVTVQTAGVRVTLIDFTLSRLVTCEGEVAHCDLESDPEIFNGPKGDIQAETYRRMRKITDKEWSKHVPATNTLWLHYLADIILGHKVPDVCTREEKSLLRGFRKDAIGASGAVDVVWHQLFAGSWSASEVKDEIKIEET